LLNWWWNILSVGCCIDGRIYFLYIAVLMVEYTFRILLYLWWNILCVCCCIDGGIYCPYIVVLKVGCTFPCSESLMKVKCCHCAVPTVYCCIGGRWEVEITCLALFSVVWADSDHLEGFRLINAVILSVVPICHDHKTS
jgi:hypothetical protein